MNKYLYNCLWSLIDSEIIDLNELRLKNAWTMDNINRYSQLLDAKLAMLKLECF